MLLPDGPLDARPTKFSDGGISVQGHFEKPPYTMQSMRSAYHVRELEVHRLSRIQEPLDVFLSHDWPRGIAHHGATAELLRKKPFFREEVRGGCTYQGLALLLCTLYQEAVNGCVTRQLMVCPVHYCKC